MNIAEGTYIIRCFLDDKSKLCYISGPPNVDLRRVDPQPSMHAIVESINRYTRTKKIWEEDLPPECFVELIHRDNETISLRQSATKLYATFNKESELLSEALRREDDPKISFIAFSNISAIGKASEFKLVAPTGNEADGVAILSMKNGCYVEIRESNEIYYLYPVCNDISQLSLQNLVKFELRFGHF